MAHAAHASTRAPNKINLSRILKLVAYGTPAEDPDFIISKDNMVLPKLVQQVKDKDVVIFIGCTGVGKTTTICGLQGIPLKWNDQGRLERVPRECEDHENTQAESDSHLSIGKNGKPQSVLPKAYPYNGHHGYPDSAAPSDLVFVDTQGFGHANITGDREEEIAACVLLEIIVKQARSIRLVIMENYASLRKGVSGISPLGQAISRIVCDKLGRKVPALFLVNFFCPQPPQFRCFPEAELVSTVIPDLIRNLQEGSNSISDNTFQRVSKNLCKPRALFDKFKSLMARSLPSASPDGAALDAQTQQEIQDVLQDPDMTAQEDKFKYIDLLLNCLQQGTIAYINPTDAESNKRLIDAIVKLPLLPEPESQKKALAFGQYSPSRIQFDEIFVARLQTLQLILDAKTKMSQYSPQWLLSCEQEAHECFVFCWRELAHLDSDPREIPRLQHLFATSGEVSSSNISNLQSRISSHQQKISEAKDQIIGLLGKPDRCFLHLPVYEPYRSDCWWPSKEITYPQQGSSGLPISKYEINLRGSTVLKPNGTSINLPCSIRLLFKADSRFTDCEAEVFFFVAPPDDPEVIATKSALEAEIAGHEGAIAECQREIDRLNSVTISDTRSRIQAMSDSFEEKRDRFQGAIKVQTQVDQMFQRIHVEASICYAITSLVQSDFDVFQMYRQSWEALEKVTEFAPGFERCALDDNIWVLDPVQIDCPRGHHENHRRVYERRKLAEHFIRSNSQLCPAPSCGAITTVLPVAANIDDVVNQLAQASAAAHCASALIKPDDLKVMATMD